MTAHRGCSPGGGVCEGQGLPVPRNIKTDLYTKPTATHQYLHATSCHPHHNKTSIPYSQALRLRRICSNDGDLRNRIEELQLYLEQRGYNKEALAPQFERATAKPREDCLLPSLKKRQSPQIPLVVTYSPTLPSLSKITGQHHHILHLSERTKRAFPQPPTIAYRRPKNLRDLLVRADLAPRTPHPPGNNPCGRSRCKTCSALNAWREFLLVSQDLHLKASGFLAEESSFLANMYCTVRKSTAKS